MAIASIFLNPQTWDWMLDNSGDIALATSAYAIAQDAASAIQLFIGEYYYDITQGVPYFATTLGKSPPLQLIKAQAVAAALTVPGAVSAQCFISSIANRQITGQIQITTSSGQVAAAGFFV
jgi:hypothetical protein